MHFIQVVVLFFLLLIFLNLLQNLNRLRSQKRIRPKKPLPFVSVLIPARNEEINIENCVSSLLKSNYPHLEIIVLDDNSSDKTYDIVKEIAEHHETLRIVKGKKLPPGWNGKNWACHQLSQIARGDWLLFTDADTIHKPHSISTALAAAQKRKSDFVSCIPGFITKTWSEKLYFPVIHFVFVALFPFRMMNFSKDSRLSFAMGPFLFIRRDFYASWGGYEAIKTEVVDDIAMAKKVKEYKSRLRVKGNIIAKGMTKKGNITLTISKDGEEFKFTVIKSHKDRYELAEKLEIGRSVSVEGIPKFGSAICTNLKVLDRKIIDGKQLSLEDY